MSPAVIRNAERVIAVLVPILLVALNTRLLTSDPYVRWGLDRVAVPPGMDRATRDASALAVADYVTGRHDGPIELGLALAGEPLARGAHIDDEGVAFDGARFQDAIWPVVEAEVEHLADVRQLLYYLWWFAVYVVVVSSTVAAVHAWMGPDRRAALRLDLARLARRGGLLTLALVALVGLGVATGWERTFVLFHRLLFPQGNWAFPADSLLIQLFPDRFWFEAAVALVGLTALEALALVAWGRRGSPESARATSPARAHAA